MNDRTKTNPAPINERRGRRDRSPARAATIATRIVGSLFAMFPLAVGPSAGAQDWVPPVDAAISDPFRPPASRFGAGNRGLEYDLAPGTSVRAVDDGIVSFSGSVGSNQFVVVQHPNGLRSTYAFLSDRLAIRGQRVGRGDVVGKAGQGFHLTARLGEAYVDPALLFAGASVGVALSGGVAPPQAQAGGRQQGNGMQSGAGNWQSGMLQSLDELRPSSVLADLASGVRDWSRDECTDGATSVAAASPDRVIVQVGGLGSSSDDASIGDLDLEAVGYDGANVVAFSYAGGCTPLPFGDGDVVGSLAARLNQSTYGPADTYGDLYQSAERLADLIDAIEAERPGAPIDIAAHSLGGVVTRLALEILSERHGSELPVDVAITISSPHQGADLGTAATMVNESSLLAPVVANLVAAGDEMTSAISVAQVGEAGPNHLDPPESPPPGVRVVAVAGSTDLIVPAESARWTGAVNSLIDTDIMTATRTHSSLPGHPDVARELALAVAGAAPRCVGLATVVRGAVEGAVVDVSENAGGVLVGIASWLL